MIELAKKYQDSKLAVVKAQEELVAAAQTLLDDLILIDEQFVGSVP